MRIWALCACWLALVPAWALAQVTREVQLDTADNQVRSSLERAAGFLQEQQAEEAVEILVRVLETSGDELILDAQSGADEATYVPVSRRCQIMLCGLGEAGLAAYRRRADPLARQWLELGRRDADPQRLSDVARQLLASSVGDDALLLLGELALERGQPAAARRHWERISPQLTAPTDPAPWMRCSAGSPLWKVVPRIESDSQWTELAGRLAGSTPGGRAVYPATDLPLADVRARLVLASIMEGSRMRAEAELSLLEHLHPGARGQLAGRDGDYATTLRQVLQESRQWRPRQAAADNWPTLAGDPTRNHVAAAIDNVAGPSLWSVSLPPLEAPLERLGADRLRPGERHGALLSYHPVVVDNTVVISEAHQIRALDLHTGEPRFEDAAGAVFRVEPWQAEIPPHPVRPHAGVARFTLTASGTRVFARSGPLVTGSANPDAVKGSQLLALDLAYEGKLLWSFPIDCGPQQTGGDPEGWSFEGAPLYEAGRLYAAVRRQDGVRTSSYVDCYDVASGALRWRTRVCSGRTWAQVAQLPDDPPWDELSHQLLTLADGVLFVSTNLGLVAAVETATGRVQWAAQYARAELSPRARNGHAFRNLTPCLVHGDLVIAASADSASILAFDRFNGARRWSSDAELTEDVVHLLGAADGWLLASGDRLSWIDLDSGQVSCQFPEGGSADLIRTPPRPRGYGRGLLAGDSVLWPTRRRIYAFARRPAPTESGWRPVAARSPIDLFSRGATGGNLALASGVLLVAGHDTLYAFSAATTSMPSESQ